MCLRLRAQKVENKMGRSEKLRSNMQIQVKICQVGQQKQHTKFSSQPKLSIGVVMTPLQWLPRLLQLLLLLLMLSISLIPARCAIISGVEFTIIRIFRIRIVGRRTLWLVQRIGSFILFPHAVDNEHDHEYGTQ